MGGFAAAVTAGGASAQTSPPPLIDVHHHAIPDFWLAVAEPTIGVQGGVPISPQWRGWTPEKSLAAMDRTGVAMALLSISAPGTWLGGRRKARALTRRCNERLAEVVAARPSRFGFHAALALPDIDGTLREIEHSLDVLKADGIGVMTSYDGKYLGDPAFTPILEALNARKAVVYVHPVAPACCSALMPQVSPNFIEFLHDTNRTILSLMFSGALHRFRDISWIFSHAGGSLPMMTGRISGLLPSYPEAAKNVPDGYQAELARLHFDVANATHRAAFGAMSEVVPMTQVVFGTDFPIIPIERTRDGLGRLNLPIGTAAAIAQGNALHLYSHLAARLRLASRSDEGGVALLCDDLTQQLQALGA